MLAAADRCLAIAPNASACLRRRADVHNVRGQCKELEKDARRLLAMEPQGYQGPGYLLAALAAQGAPVEALRQLASQEEAAIRDSERRQRFALQDAADLAVYAGDFSSAATSLRALQAMEATLTEEAMHTADGQLISVYEETDPSKALAVAADYLRTYLAWNHDRVTNARVAALAALRRTQGVTEDQARTMRDEWVLEWRSRTPERLVNEGWQLFFAEPAQTSPEATEAMAALPAFAPLPPEAPSQTGARGRVYALTGDAEAAIPLLRTARALCGTVPYGVSPVVIDDAMDQMHDRLLLGMALEQVPDRDEACAEYGGIVARWGGAKGRSVTVERARARSKEIGCR
jgi:serine/threonine-protein kinase